MPDIFTNTKIKTEAVLICPECSASHKVVMPTEGKQHFYKCPNEECEANVATKEGECCVFCSHSDQPCPTKQIDPTEDEKPKLQSLI
jgi:hypothetical protein